MNEILHFRKQQPCRTARRPKRVAVVGGGIAGLVVAYRRMLAGDEVTLLEANGRLGGQLWTEARDGFVVEHGAEGFALSSPTVLGLSRELGTKDQIVGQLVRRSYDFDGHGLEILEAGAAPARLGLRVPRAELGQGIASFRGGMGELVAALVERIGRRVSLRLNDPVWQLLPSGSSWELGTGSLARLRVDSVVLATGSHLAARLLKHGTAESFGLERAAALSSVTVSLAFERAAIEHELDGTGFVIADSVSLEGCRACAFASSKLPGRAPAEYLLLRLFFRPSPSELETMPDQAWTERAERVLRTVLAVKRQPVKGWVSRWQDGLAVVDADQQRRVAHVERRLASRGILLAGGAFHGPGIERAVQSAEAAVLAIDAEPYEARRSEVQLSALRR
jgi:oxygen-dependent protoporphyrinogen oxidase